MAGGGRIAHLFAALLAALAICAVSAGAASAQTVGPVSCGVDPTLYTIGSCTVTVTPKVSITCGEIDEFPYFLTGCRLRSGDSVLDCGKSATFGLYSSHSYGCTQSVGGGDPRREVTCSDYESHYGQSNDCRIATGTSLGVLQAFCFQVYLERYCGYQLGSDPYNPRARCLLDVDHPLQNKAALKYCLSDLRD